MGKEEKRIIRGPMVRTAKPKKPNVQKLMYYRALPSKCQEFDPNFSKESPCILARKDDSKESELLIKRGSKIITPLERKDAGFSPRIFSKEDITLVKTNTMETIATTKAVAFIEPQGYVPLYANTDFDGRGVQGGGMVPRQKKKKAQSEIRSRLLRETGITLGEARSFLTINGSIRSGPSRGYLEPASYDIALIHSINQIDGVYGDTTVKFIDSWLARFSRHDFIPNMQEKAIFEHLRSRKDETTTALYFFQMTHPHYFEGGLGSFYADIASEHKVIQTRAINVVRHHVLRRILAENSLDSDKYLNLFNNGIALAGIIPFAGRYDFDPMPLLKTYYATPHINEYTKVNTVLLAACLASQMWTESLKDFVKSTVNNKLKTEWVKLKEKLPPKALSKIKLPVYGIDRKPRCY